MQSNKINPTDKKFLIYYLITKQKYWERLDFRGQSSRSQSPHVHPISVVNLMSLELLEVISSNLARMNWFWWSKVKFTVTSCMSHSHNYYISEVPGRNWITSGTNTNLDRHACKVECHWLVKAFNCNAEILSHIFQIGNTLGQRHIKLTSKTYQRW